MADLPTTDLLLAMRQRLAAIWSAICAVYHNPDPRSLELHAGWSAILFGAWLLNPAWSSFASTPTFRAMAQIAGEGTWGLAFVALGVVQLVALIAGRSAWRRQAAFAAAIAWSLIVGCFAYANLPSTAVAMYTALVVANGFAYVSLGTPHGH